MSAWKGRNAAGALSHGRDRKGRWSRGARNERAKKAYSASIKAGYSTGQARRNARLSKRVDKGTAAILLSDDNSVVFVSTGAAAGSINANNFARMVAADKTISVANAIARSERERSSGNLRGSRIRK